VTTDKLFHVAKTQKLLFATPPVQDNWNAVTSVYLYVAVCAGTFRVKNCARQSVIEVIHARGAATLVHRVVIV